MGPKAVPIVVGCLAAAMLGLIALGVMAPERPAERNLSLRVCADSVGTSTSTPEALLSAGEYVGQITPADFGLRGLDSVLLEPVADDVRSTAATYAMTTSLSGSGTSTTAALFVTGPGVRVLAANGPVVPVMARGRFGSRGARVAVGVWLDTMTASLDGDGRCPEKGAAGVTR